ALQRLEAAPEEAFARRLDLLDDQLEFAACLVQGHPRADEHLVAVRERERERPVLLAEHRAADLAGRVLQRPVEMARGRPGQVRDLAFDPEADEAPLEDQPRLAIQRGDGINPAVLAERQLECFPGAHGRQYTWDRPPRRAGLPVGPR